MESGKPVTFSLADALRGYRFRYPRESELVDRFELLLREGNFAFRRDRGAGHLTASAWVLAPSREAVLLIYHRKLERWLQPGGHADGEEDLLAVARREVLEETGLSPIPVESAEILDLDIHRIPARGAVREHDHFDVRFLMVAFDGEEPRGNHETRDARWIALDEIESFNGEESVLRMREKGSLRGSA